MRFWKCEKEGKVKSKAGKETLLSPDQPTCENVREKEREKENRKTKEREKMNYLLTNVKKHNKRGLPEKT